MATAAASPPSDPPKKGSYCLALPKRQKPAEFHTYAVLPICCCLAKDARLNRAGGRREAGRDGAAHGGGGGGG